MQDKDAELQRLRDVLAWYADPTTHDSEWLDEEHTGVTWPIFEDKGRRAREALGLPEPPSLAERLMIVTAGGKDDA